MGNPYKVYVSVVVEFDFNAHMRPRSFTWENGTVYKIDKVLDVRQTYARKAGSSLNDLRILREI